MKTKMKLKEFQFPLILQKGPNELQSQVNQL